MTARDELRVAAWAKARALLTVERDAWAAAPYPSTREAWEAARRASEAARAAWAAACDLDRDARAERDAWAAWEVARAAGGKRAKYKAWAAWVTARVALTAAQEGGAS